MSRIYGSQGIGCNVSSCAHFKNNLCTLNSIQVGFQNNVSSGLSEEETQCLSYKRRDVQGEDRAEHIERFDLHH
ncbi:MAG: DUF1540 domain-containing protein [Syntrophomonadaceae bacterium]|nr:DUF1540 domain-containing protein [Syntrophomonadaceae bacterium]